jgi:UDP-N-acetylmuramoyl-tripeptide--D-alanyl-D-alanine ligase
MMNFKSTEELYVLFTGCKQKITTDTRKLEPGSIFFALKGDNFDANTFAQKAIEGGCRYAIVDNEAVANGTNILLVHDVLESLQQLAKYHRKQLGLPVIGITGSNAKTTHKELINAVLAKKYRVYATRGNLNNHIGVPLTLLSLTPEHEIAIVEMGANHQGEIALLSDLADPDYGVITNIGKAHLEGFGGVEGIKKGKSELYKQIEKKNGQIFINADDPVLLELSGNIRKITYGIQKEYDVYGKLHENSEFVELSWNIGNKALEGQPLVKTNMFGHYNFVNVLCAVCIGNYFKVNDTEINKALEEYVPEMNRSQVKKTENNTLILDAYNANPSSMGLAIDNFVKQPFQHKLLILGDMLELGEYSYAEHEKIIQKVNGAGQEAMFVGNLFYELKDRYPQFAFYKTADELASFFEQSGASNKTVLIKGSRGIKLEKIVEFL